MCVGGQGGSCSGARQTGGRQRAVSPGRTSICWLRVCHRMTEIDHMKRVQLRSRWALVTDRHVCAVSGARCAYSSGLRTCRGCYSDTGMKATSQRKATKVRKATHIEQQKRNTDNGGNGRDHCGYLRVSMLVPPISVFMVVVFLCVAIWLWVSLRYHFRWRSGRCAVH